MRLFPHIKKNLIAFMKEGKIIILSFLIFPMVMAFIYGTMQQDMFEGKSSFEPIRVEFNYNKTSPMGQVLDNVLSEKSVQSFIQRGNENPKCKVDISEDFKDIKITKLDGTDNEVELVRSFMVNLSEGINQYEVIENKVNSLNITESEKGILIDKLLSEIEEGNGKPVIRDELIEGYRTIGAREYYTISMFSFTSIIFIVTIAKWYYRDRKQGVIRRSFSTPNKKEVYLFGYLTSAFILVLFANILFVTINRVLGIAFMDNFIVIIAITLIQSLLQTAVLGALVAFIKSEKIANAIMNALVFLSVIIGGVFFNIELIGAKVLKVVADFSPNSLILNSYKTLSITQSFSAVQSEVVIMCLLSLILLIASVIKVKISWEE